VFQLVQVLSCVMLFYVSVVLLQAKLANEKNILAGQVKKLMRDVAKVVIINTFCTSGFSFDECAI
jgi:hypothetical protein